MRAVFDRYWEISAMPDFVEKLRGEGSGMVRRLGRDRRAMGSPSDHGLLPLRSN